MISRVLPHHFTASVMGNPDYLKAVKDIPQAMDQRLVGIERLNAVHAAAHEKRVIKQEKPWQQ